MLVWGIYYPAGKRKNPFTDDVLDAITSRLPPQQPVDTESAARAVFRIIENHISPGEIRDVIDTLPKEIRALRPPLSEATAR
ncbi:uncharacterized protein (DUF2267 family) [Bradyrhizobium elkanii]|uniref:DUF2267 domain-containing protein n=1 Tax=Bradyrhizobium TaxID=374 RepID=UPI0021682CA6|nr:MULTISPECIES: DUF2267 domain-containing protein [Bradyrhizobium]MCS3928970.1 uncharacterized protein (DUF2267 family) [Bradyrhizobium elkanii]MCS3969526.1 uncharacterized protein (DUF2267 family) [Bradyrhizobium japonicum]